MHDGAPVLRRQVGTAPAEQAGQLVGVVPDEPASHHPSGRVDDIHRIVGGEVAADRGDASREQGRTPGHQGIHRAVVHVQPAARRTGVPQPEQPHRRATATGGEERADRLPGQRLGGVHSGGQQHRNTRLYGDGRRLELAGHAAGAETLGARRPNVDRGEIAEIVDLGDQACPGGPRIPVVQAVDVGEQHQRAGDGEVCHQGRKPVVVAEADLVGGNRVVLVDDRNDAEGEQPFQGPLRVAVVRPPVQVVGGQQHLPDGELVPRERGGVLLDEQQLPDAGRGLLCCQVAWPTHQAERRHPRRDGAGGDEDDLPAGQPLRRHGVGERSHPDLVEATGQAGQRRRADLDHEPIGHTDLPSIHHHLTPGRRDRRTAGGPAWQPAVHRPVDGTSTPAGSRCLDGRGRVPSRRKGASRR